jgi:ElaB/YqjD/DUF883 family membrane-anchored ribosome-binding protein
MNDPANQGTQGGATEQLRDKASEVTQNLRDIGGQVKDVAGEKYNQLRDQASEYYHQGRETAQEWEQSLEGYVQEKPLQAVVIAAGIGLVLGLLWKRS